MRDTCRNARADALDDFAADLETLAASDQGIKHVGSPYVNGGISLSARMARAKALAIRNEGATPAVQEFREGRARVKRGDRP